MSDHTSPNDRDHLEADERLPDELAMQLRALGAAVDAAAPPVERDPSVAATVGLHPRQPIDLSTRRRRLLTGGVAIAAVASVAFGLVIWQGGDRDDRSLSTDLADDGADGSDRGSDADEDRGGDGPGADTPDPNTGGDAESDDRQEIETFGSMAIDDSWMAIAEEDRDVILVVHGSKVTLFATDGRSLGTLDQDGLADLRPEQRIDIDVFSGVVQARTPTTETPGDCEFADHDGALRIAACGGESSSSSTDLVRIDAAGTRTPMVGAPPEMANESGTVVGHWSDVRVSPDGRWVGGQWTGECETRMAYVIDPETGSMVRPNPTDVDFPESTFLGWLPDGRAALHFFGSPCSADEASSVWAYDPATAGLSGLLDRQSLEGVTTSESADAGISAIVTARFIFQSLRHADHLVQALEDAGLELLGGDHPGPWGADQMVEWNGGEHWVHLVDSTSLENVPGQPEPRERRVQDIDGFTVTVLSYSNADSIAARCGADTITFTAPRESAGAVAVTLDDLTGLVRAVAPSLGCTLHALA